MAKLNVPPTKSSFLSLRRQLDVIEAAIGHVSRFSSEMRARAEAARLEVIDE